MITKEKLDKMKREDVCKMLRAKQMSCKTIAEEVKMYYADQEYITIKEWLMEHPSRRV